MENGNTDFNLQKALQAIQNGQPLLGKEGILNPLIKQVTEAALEGEIDSHLAQECSVNRHNGKSNEDDQIAQRKFSNSPRHEIGAGLFRLSSSRNIKQRSVTNIEGKIIALYGLGMSYKDISSHLQEMYGLEVSSGTLAAVTDKILQTVKEWQARPLESIYPIVWLDAIHYKIRENGRVQGHAVYTILGVNLEGKKEVLGLYLSENEGSRFWLQVLTDLSNRGVCDILIACVDGLKGFPEAIESIFPKTEIQLCIVHQTRNSLEYIASKDQKAFMADLKRVYKAANKALACSELDRLEGLWDQKSPIVIRSWQNNWERLSGYFKVPEAIRRIIYTTNIIEALHRQCRKSTQIKGAFPNENSLLKRLYLGIQNASKKWTMPIQNWALTLSQLAMFFEGRLDRDLENLLT